MQIPPASVTHAPSRAFRLLPFRHRFVHTTGRSHLPGGFRRRTRQHLRPPTPPSAPRLPRVPASLSLPPPASGHRRRRRAAASSLEPPPPVSGRRLPPSPSVWCRAVRRPPFGTDRKRSKLGSWARTSARALGTHGSPPPVAEGHRNGSPPPSAAGPPRPRPFLYGPWSCRRPWNRRPPATRCSWEPPVTHILCRVCSGVSDALNV